MLHTTFITTYLSEITGVILIHEESVVVLTTGVTSTTGMLSVLSYTTVTAGDVTTLLSILMQSGRLYIMKRE